MTVSPIPGRQAQTVEFHLGSSPAGRTDGGFEATLLVTPGEAPRVRLTQLGWGEGVGWFAQQSLELDLNETHQIAALLGRAPRSAEQVPSVEQAAGGPMADPRRPIDLASIRARRPGRRRRTAPGASVRANAAPVPIARRREGTATSAESEDR